MQVMEGAKGCELEQNWNSWKRGPWRRTNPGSADKNACHFVFMCNVPGIDPISVPAFCIFCHVLGPSQS